MDVYFNVPYVHLTLHLITNIVNIYINTPTMPVNY